MTQPIDAIRQWQESAKYWAEHSDTIRLMFMPVTDALIQDAGIVQGQAVLDVAGGPGEPSLTIADVVGPTGSVTCTDAVAEMVEAARSEALKRGLSNVQFRQCKADSLPFADNTFDAAVSRLGAMFFPDPLVAVREMLRVMKPGGALAFVVWHKSELNPFCSVVTDIMSHYVEPVPGDPDAPGAFRFAEHGKLSGILNDAGATDVRERILTFEIEAPLSPEAFWKMRSETSETLRTKLSRLPTEKRLKIEKEVQRAVVEFFPNNQMRFPAQMLIVTGRKPS
jgi:ubiquinone/menaquinone biosynthesis C-methylase UbiE